MQEKVKQGNKLDIEAALQSSQFIIVRRRIFRQLLESLIYEGIVQPQSTIFSNGVEEFKVEGRDKTGKAVVYVCYGRRQVSFNRIHLSEKTILRITNRRIAEAESLATFLLEIFSLIKVDLERLSTFIDEIQQTLLKDTIAQYQRCQHKLLARSGSYDDLEGDIMDGHPYHPCYKSRLGFNLADNVEYGPDFKPEFPLVWVAVHKASVCVSASKTIDYTAFIEQELGAEKLLSFKDKINHLGYQPENYIFMPIHPWQYLEKIMSEFFQDIAENRLIPLPEVTDKYRPQQSIRTLVNRTFPQKAYVKLPLSIINTSTSRILAPHTVANASKVSDWLSSIYEDDAYLKEELKLILLKEILGIYYKNQILPELLQNKVYGLLSVIWRENLVGYLQPNENAIPFNALCHVDVDQRPFIDPWVERWGLENWLSQVLQISILPLIHLLYAHGVAMEAHAQNMVLIHQEGYPMRLALKDFHDGIRFCRKDLLEPELCPELQPTPDCHARINRNSFIETDSTAAVRDFLHDAFFFINLAEIAIFLEEQYGLPECSFWSKVAEIILNYQTKFSNLKEQFQKLDLFAETVQVEQLTKRRLFPETEIRVHAVENPLYSFRQGVKGLC